MQAPLNYCSTCWDISNKKKVTTKLEKQTQQKSIDKQIKHLEGKHRELDKIIQHNEQDSNPTSWHILASLKKKKLQLKDQIAALKNSLFK